jgi:hypothetical protein
MGSVPCSSCCVLPNGSDQNVASDRPIYWHTVFTLLTPLPSKIPRKYLLVPVVGVSRVAQYSVWLRARRPGDRGSIPGRGKRIFSLTSVSRPALGPTQPPVQWVPGVLSPGVKRDGGVTLTTHPHLVPRSRLSRSYISSPPQAPSWRVVGQV